MPQTPLINIKDLQELVGLAVVVKENVINPQILSAQNWQLCDVIGLDTLQELEGRFCSNTLTPSDIELMEAIKPFLVYYTYSKYIRASTMISTATGIVNITGDNTGNAVQSDRNLMAIEYENNAEAYTKQITKILTDNPTEFPNYITEDQRTEPKTYFI